MKRAWHRAGGALLGVAALAALWWSLVDYGRLPAPAPQTPHPARTTDPPAAGASPAPAAGHSPPGSHGSVHPDLVAGLLERWQHSSLRGSEFDGELGFDEFGRLQADAGLRRLFDYLLTLQGEFTLDEIRALLAHRVLAEHGAGIADELTALFDRYLALKQAEATVAGIEDPAERLARLAELRRQWFGAAAEAMFGDEEAHTAYTLARLALLHDRSLDPGQRAEALEALQQQRDPSRRAGESLALTPSLLAEHEALLQTQQLDPAQRAAERSALWGEAAAQRLAELDAAEADWQARLAAYASARERLMADVSLDAARREMLLRELLVQGFSEAEQRRVASLQAIGALPPGG